MDSVRFQPANTTATTAGCLVALMLMLTSYHASGEDGKQRSRGPYLGIGTGYAYLNPEDTDANARVTDRDDIAVQGFLGYDLGPLFGAELQYTNLGTSKLTPDATIDYREASVSGLYYAFGSMQARRQREGLYGFGRVGIGRLYTEAAGVLHKQTNDRHLLLGAGAEYGLHNGLALRGEYLSYDHDAKYIQVSVLYRFSDNETAPAPAEYTAPPPVTVADSDSDLVADPVDACPGTPAGTRVDERGCPVFDGDITGVNFRTNSAELMPVAMLILDDAAEQLQQFPAIFLRIQAHTDNRGAASYNLELSRLRALSVAQYLTNKGISQERLIPQAFGESFPIATNSTPEGRFKNRRVEFDSFLQP